MRRASRVALGYFLRYFTIGAILAIGGGMMLGRGIDTASGFFFGHLFLSGLIIWPAALAASFAYVRLLPRRTWRGETWRSWVAGCLGILMTWIGIALLDFYDGPPRALHQAVGRVAMIFYVPGWIVLLSNLALLLAWLIPSRRPIC